MVVGVVVVADDADNGSQYMYLDVPFSPTGSAFAVFSAKKRSKAYNVINLLPSHAAPFLSSARYKASVRILTPQPFLFASTQLAGPD